MKNKKLIGGIVIGLIMGMSLQAAAAPTIEKITAYINNGFRFEFDGTEKALPIGYHALVYEGRSYVPIRFVSESLGATVEWDDETKLISITSPEPVIVTVPAVISTNSAIDTESSNTSNIIDNQKRNYKKLPQTQEFEKFRIAAYYYATAQQNNLDQLYIRLTNTLEGTIQISQIDTRIIADGVTYTMTGEDSLDFSKVWYADIRKNETVESYITIPSAIKNVKNLHIELTVKCSDNFKTEDQIVEFDIAL